MGASKALGFYDIVALSLAMVDEVKARANGIPFDLFLGIYWRSCSEQDAQEYPRTVADRAALLAAS